jgi:hypothetical protein
VLNGTKYGELVEWYYPKLIAGVHYIAANSTQDVLDAVQWLLANPAKAAAIGRAGQDFVKRHLMYKQVLCYWNCFAHEYAKLITGVVRDPNALEIKALTSNVTDVARQVRWLYLRREQLWNATVPVLVKPSQEVDENHYGPQSARS